MNMADERKAVRMTEFVGANWEFTVEFLEKHAEKEREIKDNGEGLTGFLEWIALEEYFGARLSYTDYQAYACYFDYDERVGHILELGGDKPLIQAYRAGDKAYWTSGKQKEEVTIIRPLRAVEADISDVGVMYKVQRPDGSETDVLYDELSPFAFSLITADLSNWGHSCPMGIIAAYPDCEEDDPISEYCDGVEDFITFLEESAVQINGFTELKFIIDSSEAEHCMYAVKEIKACFERLRGENAM